MLKAFLSQTWNQGNKSGYWTLSICFLSVLYQFPTTKDNHKLAVNEKAGKVVNETCLFMKQKGRKILMWLLEKN